MNCRVTHNKKHAQINLSGRMDAKGVNENGQQLISLIKESEKAVILDLSEVEFIASIGMRLLIETARIAAQNEIGIGIVTSEGIVSEALGIAGIGSIIPMETELSVLEERIL